MLRDTLKTLGKVILKPLLKTEEKKVNGVSKSIFAKSFSRDIVIDKKDKYLYLSDEKWAFKPFVQPIFLTILDSNGKSIFKESSDDSLYFIIPTYILKNGYRIKVDDKNKFLLMDSKVVVK
jgi:hypothetical protein